MISRLRKALVAVAILGVYVGTTWQVGNSYLYGAYAVVSGIVLFVTDRRCRDYLSPGLIAVLAVLFVTVVLGGGGMEGARTSILLTTSIIAALGVLAELANWPKATAREWAKWATILICAFAILEVRVPVVRSLSDSFRIQMYGRDGLSIYASDSRDLFLTGIVRPKVFTQEPSHVAKFVGVSLAVWCLSIESIRQRLASLGVGLAVAWYALRSPSVLLCLPIVAYPHLRTVTQTAGAMRKVGRLFVVVITVLALTTAPQWVSHLPSSRAQAIGDGSDPSSLIRLDVPISATRLALTSDPIFGLGLSSTGSSEVIVGAAKSVQGDLASTTVERVAESGFGNAFLQIFAYMGIVGGMALFCVLFRTVRANLGFSDLSGQALAFIVLFSAEGTFPIVRPWLYFVIVVVALERSGSSPNPGVGGVASMSTAQLGIDEKASARQ